MIIVSFIFIVLLWNFTITLLGKADKTRLFCGIIGYSGNKPADPNLLKILLLFNMERGKDATGWAVNNLVTKDTVNVSEFLSKNSLVLSKNDITYTFIGHARASSSGNAKQIDHAHPMVEPITSKDEIKHDLILAMNGTISNIFDMSKNYDVPYVTYQNSDTEIFTKILAKLGIDYKKALAKYEGSANLVFYSTRYKDTLMVFKDPARTLFYWQKSQNEIYISSMQNSLFAIGGKKENVKEFEDDVLVKIVKGEIKETTKISKDPFPKKITHYSGPKAYNDYYSGNYGYQNTFNRNPSINNYSNHNHILPTTLDKIKDRIKKNNDYIYLAVDRYKKGSDYVHGKILLNEEGLIGKNEQDANFTMYYFFNGHLLNDISDYNKLNSIYCNPNGSIDQIKFATVSKSDLANYLYYPILTICMHKWYFVLSDTFVKDHFPTKIKNDKVTIPIKFSNIKLTYRFIDEGIDTNSMYLAVIDEVKEGKDESNIEERALSKIKKVSSIQNDNKLENLIASGLDYKKISSEFISMFWKVNGFLSVQKYFLEDVFLPYMVKEDFISHSTADAFIKTSNELPIHPCLHEKNELLNDLIDQCGNRLLTQTYENTSQIGINDVFDNIVNNSLILQNDSLKKDVISGTYSDIKEICIEYCNDFTQDSRDTNDILDAVTLILKDIEVITEDKALEIIGDNFSVKTSKLNDAYIKLRDKVKKIEDEENIGENEVEVYNIESNIDDIKTATRENIDNAIKLIEETDLSVRTEKMDEELRKFKALKESI